ncbi:MAG: hypothetical protein ABIU05_27700 [Nitrospirales bacterium]
MGMREKLEDRMKRKEQEIQEYDAKSREARAYIQALQEAVKLLPREEARSSNAEAILRPGGSAHKAFKALRGAGRPMHITELLKAIGSTNTPKNRISVGGTLARYARNNQIFLRTAPNTFSLVDGGGEDPPENFGVMSEAVEKEDSDEEESLV